MNLEQILQLIGVGQSIFASIRAAIAAFRAANPGVELPDDAELIRVLGANAASGQAEADALIARLRAQAGQ